MSESISKYINKKDTPGYGFQIYIRNETSHTHFSKPSLVHLIELKEQGLILEMPQNICQKSHSLTLFFIDQKIEIDKRVPDSGPMKEADFTCIAKVVQVTDVQSQIISAELQFTQYEVEKWKKILEQFSLKQEEITKKILAQHSVRDTE
jgi:hypothetical protein